METIEIGDVFKLTKDDTVYGIIPFAAKKMYRYNHNNEFGYFKVKIGEKYFVLKKDEEKRIKEKIHNIVSNSLSNLNINLDINKINEFIDYSYTDKKYYFKPGNYVVIEKQYDNYIPDEYGEINKPDNIWTSSKYIVKYTLKRLDKNNIYNKDNENIWCYSYNHQIFEPIIMHSHPIFKMKLKII